VRNMAQEDRTDQGPKRQTLAEIRAEIDRLYAPPVDDEDSAPDESAAPRRWLAVGVVAAAASAITMAALLMGTPAPRQALQGQERTTVTVAPGSPAVAESQQPATDVGGLPDPGAPPDDESVLRASVDLWLAATNQRDLSGVLAFYPERVPRFYLALDVSRDIVAADKARQFRRATVLEVHRTSDVALTIDPAGDSAVMRFMKGYIITGPGLSRQGESLHELRWAKRETGWTIVSERDLRVLR
jgi:hypothetical protein